MTDRDALLDRAVEALRVSEGFVRAHRFAQPNERLVRLREETLRNLRCVLHDYDAMKRAEAAELERTKRIMEGASDD